MLRQSLFHKQRSPIPASTGGGGEGEGGGGGRGGGGESEGGGGGRGGHGGTCGGRETQWRISPVCQMLSSLGSLLPKIRLEVTELSDQ